MKKITIKIKVPKKGNPWKVSVPNSSGKHYTDATTSYNKIERYLDGLPQGEFDKIFVKVDYSTQHPSDEEGWINEGAYAEKKDALYALACFLEDYTSPEFQRSKYQKWGPQV